LQTPGIDETPRANSLCTTHCILRHFWKLSIISSTHSWRRGTNKSLQITETYTMRSEGGQNRLE